jgi:hypothetical protein
MKPLNEGWISLRDDVLHDDTAEQLVFARNMFHAGALITYEALVNSKDFARTLKEIRAELDAFFNQSSG